MIDHPGRLLKNLKIQYQIVKLFNRLSKNSKELPSVLASQIYPQLNTTLNIHSTWLVNFFNF